MTHTRILHDGDLIETVRKQVDSIASIAERLKQEANITDSYLSSVRMIEMGSRLEAYVIGLRKTIDLLESRVRAR